MTNTNNGIVIEKIRSIRDILKGIEEKYETISSVAEKFGSTNLKIHNVSYYLYKAVESGIITNAESNELFQHICDCEYDFFTEWENENLCYVKRKYIGMTSSFYYLSDWYGEVVENYNVEELLKGRSVEVADYLGELLVLTHKILFENNEEEVIGEINELFTDSGEDGFEQFLEELFENDINTLNNFLEDLDTLEVIVEEANTAYDYLKDYKLVENEEALARDFLESDLENMHGGRAQNIFDNIVSKHKPLNKLEAINVQVVNDDSKTYNVSIESNLNSTIYTTNVGKGHEFSEKFIQLILEELKELLKDTFHFAE